MTRTVSRAGGHPAGPMKVNLFADGQFQNQVLIRGAVADVAGNSSRDEASGPMCQLMWPSLAASKPQRTRSRLLFPLPLAPNRASVSPAWTSNSTFRQIQVRPCSTPSVPRGGDGEGGAHSEGAADDAFVRGADEIEDDALGIADEGNSISATLMA